MLYVICNIGICLSMKSSYRTIGRHKLKNNVIIFDRAKRIVCFCNLSSMVYFSLTTQFRWEITTFFSYVDNTTGKVVVRWLVWYPLTIFFSIGSTILDSAQVLMRLDLASSRTVYFEIIFANWAINLEMISLYCFNTGEFSVPLPILKPGRHSTACWSIPEKQINIYVYIIERVFIQLS